MATRQLSPEDIRALVAQGVDPSTIPDSIEIPDQAPTQAQPQGGQSGVVGSAVRGAAQGVLPAIGAGTGMVSGAELGAGIGAVAGGGVADPVTIPLGAIIGGLGGGLLGGGIVGRGQQIVENKLISPAIGQQLATDQAQHPAASFIGSLAAMPFGGQSLNPMTTLKAGGGLIKAIAGAGEDIAAFKPTVDEIAAMKGVAKGAALGGINAAVQEKSEGKDLDPSQILLQTAVGGLFPDSSKFGQKVFGMEAPGQISRVNDPKFIQNYQALDRFGRQDGQVVDSSPAIIPPAAQQDLEGTIFRAAGIPQSNPYIEGSKLYPSPAEQSANNIEQAYKEAANKVLNIPVTGKPSVNFNPEITTRNPNVVGSSLQQEMARNQIAGEPSSSLINHPSTITPDYTGVTEQGNKEVEEESPADLAARKLEGAGDKYQETGTTKTPLQQEVESGLKANNLSPNLSPELQEAVTQEVMNRKGWIVNDQGALVDKSTGQPVRGQTLVADNVRKIALSPDLATADTPAHEGAHAVYQGLESAANNGDSRANDLLNQVNAKQKEGLDAVNAERAKKGLPAWDNEEYFADQQGLTFVKRQFNLDNENGWQRWWNDTKALLKTRWNTGSATIDDLRRAINYKMVNDSRFGAGVPSNVGAGARNQSSQEQKQTDTPAFKNWFGKSQVVDEQNNPLVVYHGGNYDFLNAPEGKAVFKQGNSGFKAPDRKLGFFFTPSKEYAQVYSNMSHGQSVNEHPIEPVALHLKLENPYHISFEDWNKIKDWGRLPTQEYKTPAQSQAAFNRLKAELVSKGYDGIWVGKGRNDSELIAFNPAQVKSATHNRGTFSAADLDIRHQPKDEGLTPEDRKAIRKSGGEGERQPYPFSMEDIKKGAVASDEINDKLYDATQDNYKKLEELIASKTPERNQPKDEGLERDYGHWIRPDGSAITIPTSGTSHEKEAIRELQKLVKSGRMSQADYDRLNIPLNSTTEVEHELYKRGYLRGVRSGDDYYTNGKYKGSSPNSKQESFIKNYAIERDLNALHVINGENYNGGSKTIYDRSTRNQPKDEGLETSHMGFIGKPFQAALDTIREIPHPLAGKVANALHQTLIDRDHIIGKQWNSIADTAKKANLTKSDDARLATIFRLERETGASKAQMLQNNAQRQVYRAAKDSLETNYKYRLANKEPVYRNGVPTMPQRDEFYSPTTTNPKIAQVYRTNTDTAEIGRLNKVFVDYQTKKLGLSQEEAESNLKDFVERMQGSFQSAGNSNNTFFNAARRAQGLPLPEEFTRPGFMANMEAYFRNQAADNAFYKNVESNPEVWGALGEKHDAWMKPVNSPPAGPVIGNKAVQDTLEGLRGEATQGVSGAVIAKSESFATATLLGPLTEFHKLVSNAFKQFTYADNPLQAARVFAHAVTNVGEGWTHAKENGKIQMTARSASDMLNSQLAFADRLAGLTRGIRQIYTLGDLTEKWNMGLLQSGNEMLVPFKIKQANEGNAGAQLLMKHLDPQWQLGKTYSPSELTGLASELSGVMHGSRDARTLPGWMLHDNEISAFFKLSSWGIAQTNSFMRDVWTPATKGNFTPLIMATMGAAVGGYVIKDLREKIAGKRSQIPSLAEIQASSRGLEGNIPALAYNAMAAASYAGFGGMLSSIARYPFDAAFKNQPTGATFPLDQLVSSSATTISQVSEAIMNDPNLNWLSLATHAGASMITSNFQLGRIALNQAIDSGAISGQIAEKKMLSDKLAELRRFNMVEGLPYQDQGGGDENPYMNLQQKQFKAETDIPTAMKEAPALIQNIIATYKSNPEIMLKKLEALKSNSYATMPDIDNSPLQFSKYVKFLTNYGGPQAAQAAIQDYYIHKVINDVKASVIP